MKDHRSIDRLQINSTNNCFITLKYHKENFENHPTVRKKRNLVVLVSKSLKI